jgi:putative ABC transport system substrate-binding protein
MRRRQFMAVAMGAVAWPLPGRAQHPNKIGILNLWAGATTVAVMRPAWQRLGYVEGQNVLLRAAQGEGRRFATLIAELMSEGIGVLIPVGAEAVRVASQTAAVVPIVAIDLETDPVRAGFARSIARPGGNITGLFLDLPSLAGKWIELLQELAPDVKRIALSWDPTTGRDQLEVAKQAAAAKGLEVEVLEVGTRQDYEAAFKRLGDGRRTGLIQLSSPGFGAVAASFAAAAKKYNIPTIAFLKSYARANVLLTYGPNEEEYFPRAIAIADKILRGAKPAELPIELATKFELVINVKTATALGLTVPPSLLARADEVIE